MDKLVLYCKSYSNDVDRVKILLDSINIFNKDKLPFYISTPKKDRQLFESKLGTKGWNWIADEEIDIEGTGWKNQQVIKSQYWKLNLCDNYVCIDSDSQFIKPFYINDFMYNEDTPYTVCHQQKQLFDWSIGKLPFDPIDGFRKDRKLVMDLFDRKGVFYDFGPSPTIWSKKVWQSLEESYIKPNNLTFSKLIDYSPSEFSWYGEWLLTIKFPIYPLEPLFKVYHYKQQYLEDKQKGITLDNIKDLYLGVILQSNWGAPLKY